MHRQVLGNGDGGGSTVTTHGSVALLVFRGGGGRPSLNEYDSATTRHDLDRRDFWESLTEGLLASYAEAECVRRWNERPPSGHSSSDH